jgi:hypothetical protein
MYAVVVVIIISSVFAVIADIGIMFAVDVLIVLNAVNGAVN